MALDTTDDKGLAGSILGKYYTKMTIGKYSRPHPFASSKFELRKILYFPLPVDLRDNTSVGYSDMNLESVGDIYNGTDPIPAAALRYSGDAVAAFAGNVLGDIGTMAMSRFGGPAAGGIASSVKGAIGKVIRADQITSAVQQSQGVAPNPNPSVMFTGPELRDFNHSWTFYPKNQSESERVQKIIRILKQSALPSNSNAGNASILNYPNMVQLNFYPWDDPNPINGGTKNDAGSAWGWTKNSIIRYKKCVMKNVNVNYTPGGSPGFFHGTNGAVAINISIQFMEIEYMLAGDWSGDGIGGTDTGFSLDDIYTQAINKYGPESQTIPNLQGSGIRPDKIK